MSIYRHTLQIEGTELLELLRSQLSESDSYAFGTDTEHYQSEAEMLADEEFYDICGTFRGSSAEIEVTSYGYSYGADEVLRMFLASYFFGKPDPAGEDGDSAAWSSYRALFRETKELMHAPDKCKVRFWLSISTDDFDAVYDIPQLSGFGGEFMYLERMRDKGLGFPLYTARVRSEALADMLLQYCRENRKDKGGYYTIPAMDFEGAVRIKGDTVRLAIAYDSLSMLLFTVGDAANLALADAPYAEFFEGRWTPPAEDAQ